MIAPSETIVLVAVWAAHRAPAFDACRYLIEELKHRAPFWKREILEDGARWVEKNTSI
jgi:molybdopterin synthase catalytic subunit